MPENARHKKVIVFYDDENLHRLLEVEKLLLILIML